MVFHPIELPTVAAIPPRSKAPEGAQLGRLVGQRFKDGSSRGRDGIDGERKGKMEGEGGKGGGGGRGSRAAALCRTATILQ